MILQDIFYGNKKPLRFMVCCNKADITHGMVQNSKAYFLSSITVRRGFIRLRVLCLKPSHTLKKKNHTAVMKRRLTQVLI